MFERDKDTLRDLGIPILTVTDAGHGDDIGYRVDLDAYALPPLDLTAAELGVLAMAAQVWQDQAVRADTTRALTKLRAVGDAPGVDRPGGRARAARAGRRAARSARWSTPCRRARRSGSRTARPRTGEVRERTVEPWKLLARRGGWVLVGRDRDRGASRSFRLSRIEGAVRTVGEPGSFTAPSADELADGAADLGERAGARRDPRDPARAGERARARAPSAAPCRTSRTGRADPPSCAHRDLVHVPFRAEWELAEELVGYGDAVVVLAPAGPAAVGPAPAAHRRDARPRGWVPMAERASDRLLRMLGMITYLDRHEGVPVEAIAEQFGVTHPPGHGRHRHPVGHRHARATTRTTSSTSTPRPTSRASSGSPSRAG